MSIGDSSIIGSAAFLPPFLSWMFWVTWFMAVLVTNIILMNFIVAEACACYSEVSENLESVIWKEKANMIVESELMTNERSKQKNQYPPYIIIRSVQC